MKKTCSFLVITLFSVNLFSQTITKTDFQKENYLDQSDNQKKTAWILLGGGLVLTTIGVIGFGNSDFLSSNSNSDAYGYLILGGGVCTLSSIPLFISSARNARRAASISFGTKPNLIQRQGPLTYNPGIQLCIKIVF